MLPEKGSLGWQDAARYAAEVGEALVEAHALGLIHRDVKPANILWDARRDEALLTDFGVSAHLAESGCRAGSPAYMAPEARDGHVSPALDVFSLAVTLFHLATGRLPFPAFDHQARLDQMLKGLPADDPRLRDLPESLERIIRAGLAFEAVQRPDLRQFVADLRGRLDQAIADSLIVPPTVPGTANVDLKLTVRRRDARGDYQPIPTSRPRPVGLSRNMKKVPPTPEQVQIRTGERLRVEVVADREGYLTVFNVGPTGDLSLLYPDEPPAPPPPPVPAGQTLPVVEVEMTPPAGRERLFAVWSRRPLRPDQITAMADSKPGDVSGPYRATRNRKRVQETLRYLPPEEGPAVVLTCSRRPIAQAAPRFIRAIRWPEPGISIPSGNSRGHRVRSQLISSLRPSGGIMELFDRFRKSRKRSVPASPTTSSQKIDGLNQQIVQLFQQGHFEQALKLAFQVQVLARRELGENHPDYARNLNNLAMSHEVMGDYDRAEPLYLRAAEIYRAALGENHPDYATSLNNLADLYRSTGDYAQAEPLLSRAVEIVGAALGESHPDYATSLNNLAVLHE